MTSFAVTDGAVLVTDSGQRAPLTLAALLHAMMTCDAIMPVWCAHGWDDIKTIVAPELLRQFPKSNGSADGWHGLFNTDGHFYSLGLKLFGHGFTCYDICNVTRTFTVMDAAQEFGGTSPLDATMHIARVVQRSHLKGGTIGSMALYDYIGGDYTKFRRRYPVIAAADYGTMRDAYMGGYMEAREGEYSHARSWDVNSLYPYIMATMPLPYGEPMWFDGEYTPDDDMPLHIDVMTFSADRRPDGCMPLTELTNVLGSQNIHLDSTYGYITQAVTNVDRELLKQNCSLSVYETVGGWKFRASRGFFGAYVDTWFSQKLEDAGAKRMVDKLMLNSLTGKFATALGRHMMEPALTDDGMVTLREAPKKNTPPLSYFPVAAFINAYGRQILINAIRANRRHVIYANTDGMILDTWDEPQGIEPHPTALGKWKNDYQYTKLRILGVSKYCGVCVDGHVERRLSGIHNPPDIPYEDFRHGMRVTTADNVTYTL